MITLARRHPVQLVLGCVLLAEEHATRHRQMTFAALCHKAAEWATDARDVLREIARDAGNGEVLVDEVARDGRITGTEARQLRALFAEIGTEAREGRVI